MKRTLFFQIFLVLAFSLFCFNLTPSLSPSSLSPSASTNPEPTTTRALQSRLNIYALDVGQGDSLLIVSPTGKHVLVDAGPRSSADSLIEALRRHNVEALDLVIASHPHEDHIGGMITVMENFAVRRFLDSGQAHPTQTFTRMLETIGERNIPFIRARRGQTFDLGGGARIEVLRPTGRWITRVRPGGSRENANSVVFRLTYRNFAMIFTGDAEMDTEHLLVRDGARLRADILKVGHHGSRHATGPDFLDAVHPTAAVISASSDNEYGHPTQATLDRLRGWGVRVLRTDLQGEITISVSGTGRVPFTVRSARQASEAELLRGRN